LAAIEEPGAVVAEVARRADVCTSLVYRWRRQARRERNTPGFAKVIVEDVAPDGGSDERSRTRRDLGGDEGRAGSDRRERIPRTDRVGIESAAILIPLPSGARVWIATGHTDMRRGMQGLALQVQEQLRRDPHAGDLYILRGRRGDLAKILWHDGLGLSLYAKRLDRGKFIWPSASDGVVSISAAQMAYMLEGIDWRNPRLTWRPESAG
jgi:transposase